MRQNLVGIALLLACQPACSATPTEAFPAKVEHLVFISVDGLRPDAIDAASAARTKGLIAKSAYSGTARTVGSPETLPSHVCMVTGLDPKSHGITYNKARGEMLSSPSIFTRVQEAGGKTALLFGKDKLVMLAGTKGADISQGPAEKNRNWNDGDDRALAQRFATEFATQKPRLAMVHLRAPDFIGHKTGWMSKGYLAAVRDYDAALGTILDAIDASGLAAQTAVILTADHGGEGDEHVKNNRASETIPWLCRVPGVKPKTITGAVRTVDVAPTALALLGLPPLEGIDGKVVKECLPWSSRATEPD